LLDSLLQEKVKTMSGSATSQFIPVTIDNFNNPIGKLQEMHLIAKQESEESCPPPPFYDLIDQYGDDHGPTFTMEVQYRGQKATGTGGSKKIAKTIAAANILRMILGEEKANITISVDVNTVTSTGNAVGELQEFCCMKGLCAPWYEEVSAIGPAHNKTFALTCSVGKLSERGSGPIKKVAKREAAIKVLVKLKAMTDDELKQLEDPEVIERRKKREAEMERELKEEEERRLREETEGAPESSMGTWGEEEETEKWRSFQPDSLINNKNRNTNTEVGGWGSGEAMYEGEVGVWGTDNVDQNLITSTDTATGWEDIEQMISKASLNKGDS